MGQGSRKVRLPLLRSFLKNQLSDKTLLRVIPLLLENIEPKPKPVISECLFWRSLWKQRSHLSCFLLFQDHGDLWSGNVGLSGLTNQPFIFDPAACYGHSEADLGVMRVSSFIYLMLFTLETIPYRMNWYIRCLEVISAITVCSANNNLIHLLSSFFKASPMTFGIRTIPSCPDQSPTTWSARSYMRCITI